HLAQIGTILKIITRDSLVIVMVSTLKIGGADEEGLGDGCKAQVDILGEISTNQTTKATKFFRGVRSFPVLNEAVVTMSQIELELIFNRESEQCISVGKLHQDKSIVAKVRTDDLLSKHFAIIGSTGSGKSCTVALVLQAILTENRNAHVVLFDPHNEYSKSFGQLAEVIGGDTLDLPIWLFNFEETVELLASEIKDQRREEQEILHDLILKAKQLYDKMTSKGELSSQVKVGDIEKELGRAGSHISLDSPVPYRIRDLIKLLDHEMGKLENSGNLGPYMRLKRRINTILGDPRYQFVFRNQASANSIESIIGRIFRIPVADRPISILDFSSIPSETLNIVVSVVSRLAFDLAVWSERKIPILLVCEEAHRYVPADQNMGFNSTRKIISRIAKEGRKYGVSLGIISQRPSELEPSTLSQCSTVFSMRLSNEVDQNFVRSAVPDGADELLAFLPSLGTAETMIFGESVNMPMRVILNTLAEQYRPHSSSAKFTELWAHDNATPEFMKKVFESWRGSGARKKGAPDPSQAAPTPQVQRRPASTHSTVAATRDNLRSSAQPSPSPHLGAPRKQSLADVKKILGGAFNGSR
ncbi:MAG: ATP-binding protein, partial [Hellea sp.]|nr:ATP-binding protein [Hellea sp.]